MADQRDGTDRIVVGVDGWDSSKQALRWAVRQAELTRGEVLAVTAWDMPQFHGALGWLPPSSSDEEALEGRARDDLKRAVEEAVGSRPPVEVRTEVHYGTPASVLLRMARDASLLVVGSRGLGGFAGLLLGSVAQHCAQHAACPVVVFREGGDHAGGDGDGPRGGQ
ncbi:universal stress protein [Streptomyces muensis]|uniref:Universal stress protein n=1 Tax=Streptomyces muensis TaxID=1077944 RepID=A0A9X1PVK3_STRM4|nr:universal stress protein [Streptomyces muensis]MCF1594345.1 universal stress protein [Streptomyces muensis]